MPTRDRQAPSDAMTTLRTLLRTSRPLRRGFTLAEVVLGALLLTVITLSVIRVMLGLGTSANTQLDRTQLNRQVNVAERAIALDFEHARSCDPRQRTAPLARISPRHLELYSDVDQDGTVELVVYRTTGGSFDRAVIDAHGTDAPCSFPDPQPGDFTTLVPGVASGHDSSGDGAGDRVFTGLTRGQPDLHTGMLDCNDAGDAGRCRYDQVRIVFSAGNQTSGLVLADWHAPLDLRRYRR